VCTADIVLRFKKHHRGEKGAGGGGADGDPEPGHIAEAFEGWKGDLRLSYTLLYYYPVTVLPPSGVIS